MIAYALGLIALLATAPGIAFAQTVSVVASEIAHTKSYGSGWECNRPYFKQEDRCALL